jgi:L-lysine 2,3-aminomutase
VAPPIAAAGGIKAVSVYAPRGPAGSTYGSALPGRVWPARTPGPAMAVADAGRLAGYLGAHPQVSIVEFTGADALTLSAAALRSCIEPLLEIEQLASVRLGTAALARWPYRFLTDPDADDVLRLFEQVSTRGKSLTMMADFSHPRELEPGPAAGAAARIRSAGAVICTQAPLAGSVNDAAGTWAAMWRKQVRMGMVPYAMTIQRVTGPAAHFRVPLARAQQIFARAYGSVSGLCRTVKGPAMRDVHGTVCVDGTAQAGAQKMFVLRYLQARDPHLAGGPFFAAFDADAAWLTDLQPVPGAQFPTPAAASAR